MRSGFLRFLVLSLLIQAVQPSPASSFAAETQLTVKQAEELVLNVPDVVKTKDKGGCPKSFVLWVNDKASTVFFAVHNPCDKGHSSDLIGNYTVDLMNGELWSGVDRRDDDRNVIDSPRLQELRRKLLAGTK
jgi:hypothetical protein